MKKWYVVQVFSGCEDLVKKDLEAQIAQKGMQDYFGEILIPSAKAQEFVAVSQSKDQRLFPGYLLVEMEFCPKSAQLVTSSPRVMKFLGGKNPPALSPEEVARVRATIKGEVQVAPRREEEFAKGGEIDITDGPFAGFVGIIEAVDQDAQKLTVMVSIFGRLTPVELSFNQIKQ